MHIMRIVTRGGNLIMKYYCNPMNLPYKYQFHRDLNPQAETPPPFQVYREAADPSMILFKGLYWLFPSMTRGFYTSIDMKDWTFHPFLGDIPEYDYAPDVRAVDEYMYFSASHMGEPCDFFRSLDPRTEPFEKIKGTFPFWDPNLFLDEDGRLYFYWGCSNVTPIYGVEMDRGTMTPRTEPKALIDSDETRRGYERNGENHVAPKTEKQIRQEVENMLSAVRGQAQAQGREMTEDMEKHLREQLFGNFGNRPYIEGAWMTKRGGTYYLQYAIPGTQFNVYGDGVYVSKSPLGPFVPAKNNPYSYQPGGFITGAGHGSTLMDMDGNWWHVSSQRISRNEKFERRLGLWKAGFDADGELFCDQRYGDWPVAWTAKPFDPPEIYLLSYGCKTAVSSGKGAEHITDENIQTLWKADTSAPGQWASVDLGEIKTVAAVQINFGDDGHTAESLPMEENHSRSFYEERWIDPVQQRTRWLLEGSTDGKDWWTLCDKRSAMTDLPHDLIELDTRLKLRYVRLTIQEVPYRQPPCLTGMRIFGIGNQTAPAPAKNVQINVLENGLDMDVSWESECFGANILWGWAPDKLYHSRMTLGKMQERIGALVLGQPLYVRVDTFNDSGITEGKTQKII